MKECLLDMVLCYLNFFDLVGKNIICRAEIYIFIYATPTHTHRTKSALKFPICTTTH